jgi:exosome complex exonuclease RRP6
LDIHAGRVKVVQEKKPILKEKETVCALCSSIEGTLIMLSGLQGDLQKAARLPQYILHASNLPKPQLEFVDKVDNSNGIKWQHHLSKKWHSKQPLDQMELTSDDGTPLKSHPYRYEIATLQYPDFVSTSCVPIPPRSFEATPFHYIDTKEGLFALVDQLRRSEEIAIDLEHHSYRSYYGFVCLMQVSTRSADFVVDCLIPDIRANMEILNEAFTDPTKIKARRYFLWSRCVLSYTTS